MIDCKLYNFKLLIGRLCDKTLIFWVLFVPFSTRMSGYFKKGALVRMHNTDIDGYRVSWSHIDSTGFSSMNVLPEEVLSEVEERYSATCHLSLEVERNSLRRNLITTGSTERSSSSRVEDTEWSGRDDVNVDVHSLGPGLNEKKAPQVLKHVSDTAAAEIHKTFSLLVGNAGLARYGTENNQYSSRTQQKDLDSDENISHLMNRVDGAKEDCLSFFDTFAAAGEDCKDYSMCLKFLAISHSFLGNFIQLAHVSRGRNASN